MSEQHKKDILESQVAAASGNGEKQLKILKQEKETEVENLRKKMTETHEQQMQRLRDQPLGPTKEADSGLKEQHAAEVKKIVKKRN